MEKKTVVPAWLTVVLVTLCLLALVLNVKAMLQSFAPNLETLDRVIYFLTISGVGLYCAAGCGKKAAKYFSAVTLLLAFTQFFTVLLSASESRLFPTAVCTLSFGCLAVLYLARDLGAKKSALLTAVTVVSFFLHAVYCKTVMPSGDAMAPVVSDLAVAIAYGIMVYAKYQDKLARGSK